MKFESLRVHDRISAVFYRISIRNGETPHALIAYKASKTMFICIAHGLFNTLQSPVRTTEIADFPLCYLAVKCFENIGDWSFRVISMEPIEIDRFRLQATKALIEIGKNILA